MTNVLKAFKLANIIENPLEPLVTVGLPTYNRPEALRVLLANVTGQTYKNLEILVSDNASNLEEVAKICTEISSRDPRVVYFRQEKNLGAGKNHEFLLKAGSGSLFLFLGDDDEIPENYVKECVDLLLSDPKVSLVGAVGKRYLEGSFWYEYETWDTRGQTLFSRLRDLIPLAFFNHWIFEQYWYGVFRKNHHPSALSKDFKSTIWRIFHLAANGDIAHTPKTFYKKHTTKKELENHRVGEGYRRHRWLSFFRDDHVCSIQQCVPISLQMARVVLDTKALSVREKMRLLAYIVFCFFRYSVTYEIQANVSGAKEKVRRVLSKVYRVLRTP